MHLVENAAKHHKDPKTSDFYMFSRRLLGRPVNEQMGGDSGCYKMHLENL